MRRVRTSVLLAGTLAGALLLSGCGVLADTTAASVGDEEVSVDTVNDLARDAEFMSQVIGGGPPVEENESVLEGATARSALGFEIQRAAWVHEATRLGVSIDDARAEAEQQIDGAGLGGVGRVAKAALVELTAAQQAVVEHYSQLDPESDDDLRTLYDAVSPYWDRTCFSAAAAPAEAADALTAALADHDDLEAAVDAVDGAEFLPPSDANCAPLSLLPTELAGPLGAAEVGDTTAAIVVEGPQGAVVYALHIEDVRRFGLDDARPELEQILGAFSSGSGVQQVLGTWTTLLALNAEVNSRYGSGVAAGGSGIEVVPPPVPALPSNWPALADAAASLAGQ